MGTMNLKRAAWAKGALDIFQYDTGTDNGDAIADMLCNLMHLCKFELEKYGDFQTQLERAQRNHEGEVIDDE